MTDHHDHDHTVNDHTGHDHTGHDHNGHDHAGHEAGHGSGGHQHGEHGRSRAMQRRCDVAIVGGSAAGLAAALQLSRQRRAVIVIDAGEPRNAPAAHMHGFLGRDGTPPQALTAAGRDEVRSYGGEVLAGRVERVTGAADEFVVDLVGGHSIVARRVLIATGLVDVLPDIDGLAERWGDTVIHCPFCHGYEVRDQRIVQVVTHPMALHAAPLFHRLSAAHTIVVSEGVAVDEAELDALQRAGSGLHRASVRRIGADGDGSLAIDLGDGTSITADVVAVGPTLRVRAEPFAPLGVTLVAHASGLGDVVGVDPMGATNVAGVYAAGNVTDPGQQVLQAAAAGSWVGAMISRDLAVADVHASARPSANEADWDQRYGGEQIWSGNPNGSLVAELAEWTESGRRAGTALDVGAGEGGDAVWLAERGWDVTANDVSRASLRRVRDAAADRGLQVRTLHADANALGPFPAAAFDLVTAHYASIPRTPDGRAIANLLGAVAPGGTLLVVGHDLAPMRKAIDTTRESQAFDPDAYVRVEDVVAALTGRDGWTIEVDETRARPAGAASHHVDDVILRARRQG